jgi:hypothetical protein
MTPSNRAVSLSMTNPALERILPIKDLAGGDEADALQLWVSEVSDPLTLETMSLSIWAIWRLRRRSSEMFWRMSPARTDWSPRSRAMAETGVMSTTPTASSSAKR